MLVHTQIEGVGYTANLQQPIDISMPLVPGALVPNAWYAPPFEAIPVRMGDFIGSIDQGGYVNFKNVRLNPHGNGTHTESVQHILAEGPTIHQCLQHFHCTARLISVYPEVVNGDRIITRQQVADLIRPDATDALVIRTLPNDDFKLKVNYSGAHPPYMQPAAAALLVEYGIQHLLLDLPSVDPEKDGGKLSAHHVFWSVPGQIRRDATITELIYVPSSIQDGLYLLNLQIPSFELDAAPSKPVLYALQKTDGL